MGHPVPNFKSHNIIMSARVYFKKRVKYCKDVSIIKVNSGVEFVAAISLVFATAAVKT